MSNLLVTFLLNKNYNLILRRIFINEKSLQLQSQLPESLLSLLSHDAHAAEQNNGGYNPNDPSSYSYSYTIDQEGNYHYTWQGNWSPDRLDNNYNNYNYNNYSNYSNSNNYYNYNNYGNTNQSYSNAYNQTGGLGSSYSSTSRNVHVTSTSAPSSMAFHYQMLLQQAVIYILQVNVRIMCSIELAEKSAQLGAMQITGQTLPLQQVTL